MRDFKNLQGGSAAIDKRTDILGVGFDDLTPEGAVARALEIIYGGERGYVVTPNPEIVWLARRDTELRRALAGADIVLADGVGITIGSKILGTPLSARIPGIDFASMLMSALGERGGSIYLLGAAPGVAGRAGEALAREHPGLVIAGCADGYFTDSAPVIETINAQKPDLLLVCLGAPKQEKWLFENIEKLEVRLAAGLGGALDVYAGCVKRAPKVFRRLGLEWLYRLFRQPSRIKRMIKLPLFVLAALWRRIRGKNNG